MSAIATLTVETQNDGSILIRTSKDLAGDTATFMRFFHFANRARKAHAARNKNMRPIRGYGSYRVTATHAGDLRVGCTLIEWNELARVYHELTRRMP